MTKPLIGSLRVCVLDGCKSQALLTEDALLSCMAYVDLNPVRATLAETPETSGHTSIKERLTKNFRLADAIRDQTEQRFLNQFPVALKPLAHFENAHRNEPQHGILFTLKDYLELVDYTGGAIHPTKPGYIPEHQPPILSRLGLSPEEWLTEATEFEARYQDHHRDRLDRRRSAA